MHSIKDDKFVSWLGTFYNPWVQIHGPGVINILQHLATLFVGLQLSLYNSYDILREH